MRQRGKNKASGPCGVNGVCNKRSKEDGGCRILAVMLLAPVVVVALCLVVVNNRASDLVSQMSEEQKDVAGAEFAAALADEPPVVAPSVQPAAVVESSVPQAPRVAQAGASASNDANNAGADRGDKRSEGETATPGDDASDPDGLQYWENFCDPEIPTYDLDEWKAEHGSLLPDTPAIFRGHGSKEAIEQFGTLDKFMKQFEHERFPHPPKPEYGNPGGFGAHVPNKAERMMTVGELLRQFRNPAEDKHLYFSQFSCKLGSICGKVYPSLGTPRLFDGPTVSVNFLIGGPQSGLPLHSHSKTWQGLASGRKLWFFLPPGRVTKDLHDMTGPYLFPIRGFAKMTQGLPLGQRPLICVQKPGDIFYFPDEWLHGTLNLDEFQLAWGGKPAERQVVKDSPALQALRQKFPIVENQMSKMDYMLSNQVATFTGTCARDGDAAIERVDGVMQRMRRFSVQAKSVVHNDALVDNAAFAFCSLSIKVDKSGCPIHTKQKLVDRWRTSAREISPEVFKAECPA